MSLGYFIHVGDKTSCGGTVLGGDQGWLADGRARARQGDPVSCGEDGKTYPITGGVSYILLNGQLAAGTLDSVAGCPCGAILIPSIMWAAYANSSRRTDSASAFAGQTPTPPAAPTARPAAAAPAPSTPPAIPSPRAGTAMASTADANPQEPGFYIVEKTTRRSALYSALFESPNFKTMTQFHALNPGGEVFKAGTLIVLSDPNNHQCTREEAVLMEAAAIANQALESMSTEQADFMMQHRDEIATFLGYGSTSIGVTEVMLARYLKQMEQLLEDIESLHKRSFLRDGHLRSPTFFAERKRLFSQLDMYLNGLSRKGAGIPDHPNLKGALGISSRSLVHHWSKAGAPGQIPGYSTHINRVSKTAKVLKAGGWVGIALGGGASYLKVQEVCAAGDSDACEKVKFTEAGSFAAGLATSGAVGSLSTFTAAPICVAIGVGTVGLGGLACGLVVVGGATYIGAKLGEMGGEALGTLVYEAVK